MQNHHILKHTKGYKKAKIIQAYLLKFNLTLDYKSDKEIKNGIKIVEKTQLKYVIKDPFELTKLSLSKLRRN